MDVFFVISGFLITQIIIRENSDNTFDIWKFYSRRIKRLAPALYVVLTVTMVMSWFVLLPDEFEDVSKAAMSVVLFSSNIFFWQAEADYFATPSLYNPLLHMWSLSVEEQFYFLFSFWLLFSKNVLGKKSVLSLIALLLLSIALAEWGVRNYPTASYYLIFTRCWELILGCLGAVYLQKNAIVNARVGNVFTSIGIALISISFVYLNEHSNIPGLAGLLPCVGCMLVILFGKNSKVAVTVLGNRVLVFIGLISYSIYLWHQPIFVFARIMKSKPLNTVDYLTLILVIISLSFVTWKFIEQPFRKIRVKSNFLTTGIFILCSVSILTITLLTVSNGGNRSHLSEKTRTVVEQLQNEKDLRSKTTLYDVCHFRPDLTDIGQSEFIKQWKCFGSGEMKGIIVVGDSHAADIAHSLRENGLEVGQLTGAGCSLEPNFMARHCKALFTYLKKNYIDKNMLRGVILANRYNEYEMSLSAVSNTNEFWNSELQSMVFTSKPEYPRFLNQLVRNELKNTEQFYVDFSRAIRSFEIYNAYERENQLVVDTKEVFCSMVTNDHCEPEYNGSYMISDGSHFSNEGAKVFGQAIKNMVAGHFKN